MTPEMCELFKQCLTNLIIESDLQVMDDQTCASVNEIQALGVEQLGAMMAAPLALGNTVQIPWISSPGDAGAPLTVALPVLFRSAVEQALMQLGAPLHHAGEVIVELHDALLQFTIALPQLVGVAVCEVRLPAIAIRLDTIMSWRELLQVSVRAARYLKDALVTWERERRLIRVDTAVLETPDYPDPAVDDGCRYVLNPDLDTLQAHRLVRVISRHEHDAHLLYAYLIPANLPHSSSMRVDEILAHGVLLSHVYERGRVYWSKYGASFFSVDEWLQGLGPSQLSVIH